MKQKKSSGSAYGSYEITAEFYDKINAAVDFSAWADFIEAVFSRYCVCKPRLVLDLACGTGTLTRILSRRGYDMTGVDLSPEMLSCAREKDGGSDILWLCQDMRSFELYGTVDAVISTCDSINYLRRREDVKACFSLVHNYLNPDGIFLFDVTSRAKFREIYGKTDIIIDGGDVYCGWQNRYNEKSGIADFYLTYFIRNGDLYERCDEEQRQRCYTVRSLYTLLAECGFEPLLTTSRYDMTPLAPGGEDDGDTERIYIAARVRKTERSGNNGMNTENGETK